MFMLRKILNSTFTIPFLILPNLITASTSLANESYSLDGARADFSQLLQNIQKIQGTATANPCKIGDSKSCQMEDYCEQIAPNKEQLQLYKNEEGRSLPNFVVIENLNFLNSCGANDFITTVGQTEPYSQSRYAYYPPRDETPEYKTYVKNLNAQLSKDVPRIKKSLETTRQGVIRFIESKRNSKNSKEVDNIIDRVKKIKMVDINFKDDIQAASCAMPNAFYSPDEHSILICPSLFNIPEAALEQVLAHELSHGIDPCALTRNYMGVENANKGEGFKALKPDEGIFAGTLKCLAKPTSMNVRSSTADQVRKELEALYDETMSEFADEYANEDSAGNVSDTGKASFIEEQLFKIGDSEDEIGRCFDSAGSAQTREAFSDWVSSKVLSEKIKNTPDINRRKQIAFESMGLFLATGCNAVIGNSKSYQGDALKNYPNLMSCSKAAIDSAKEQESRMKMKPVETHPSNEKRSTRLFLSDPEFQKALGCKKISDVENCK